MLNKMDRIYHGCFTKNADGMNRLLVLENSAFFQQLDHIRNMKITGPVKTTASTLAFVSSPLNFFFRYRKPLPW